MVCRNGKQQNLPDSERDHERCETSAGKPLPHSRMGKKSLNRPQNSSGQAAKWNPCQQECPVAVQKTAKLQLNCHAGSRRLVCRYKANEQHLGLPAPPHITQKHRKILPLIIIWFWSRCCRDWLFLWHKPQLLTFQHRRESCPTLINWGERGGEQHRRSLTHNSRSALFRFCCTKMNCIWDLTRIFKY